MVRKVDRGQTRKPLKPKVLGLSGSEPLFNDFLISQDLQIAFSCPRLCVKGAQEKRRACII